MYRLRQHLRLPQLNICINLSPIESILQYHFATPKPLKIRWAPDCCVTVPLCTDPVATVRRTSRSVPEIRALFLVVVPHGTCSKIGPHPPKIGDCSGRHRADPVLVVVWDVIPTRSSSIVIPAFLNHGGGDAEAYLNQRCIKKNVPESSQPIDLSDPSADFSVGRRKAQPAFRKE